MFIASHRGTSHLCHLQLDIMAVTSVVVTEGERRRMILAVMTTSPSPRPPRCTYPSCMSPGIAADQIFTFRVVTKRREEIRRQRIESEQRRRDELRDGYRRLKDVLPVSNQKSSKVSLLDRGESTTLGSVSILISTPFSHHAHKTLGGSANANVGQNQRAGGRNQPLKIVSLPHLIESFLDLIEIS